MYRKQHQCTKINTKAQKSTPKHKKEHQCSKININAQKTASMHKNQHQRPGLGGRAHNSISRSQRSWVSAIHILITVLGDFKPN
jgi:hypothetical protein